MRACVGLYFLFLRRYWLGMLHRPPLTGGRRASLLFLLFVYKISLQKNENTMIQTFWRISAALECTIQDAYDGLTRGIYDESSNESRLLHVFSPQVPATLFAHISASGTEGRLCGHTRYLTDTLGPPPIYNGESVILCIHLIYDFIHWM